MDMTNGSITKEMTAGKYIFWDIDGTLAPYRVNDSVAQDYTVIGEQVPVEISEHFFLLRKPSHHMQKVIASCKAKENIVVGHFNYEQEEIDKQLWLDKYYPVIRERFFIPYEASKADIILAYCAEYGIDLEDVIFVDDVIPFIREAELKGIRSYHISSFLDWEC